MCMENEAKTRQRPLRRAVTVSVSGNKQRPLLLLSISADVCRGRTFKRFRSKTRQPYFYQIGHPYYVNIFGYFNNDSIIKKLDFYVKVVNTNWPSWCLVWLSLAQRTRGRPLEHSIICLHWRGWFFSQSIGSYYRVCSFLFIHVEITGGEECWQKMMWGMSSDVYTTTTDASITLVTSS